MQLHPTIPHLALHKLRNPVRHQSRLLHTCHQRSNHSNNCLPAGHLIMRVTSNLVPNV